MRASVAVLAWSISAGCLAAPMTAGESLRDAVFHYNDAVRWGRPSSALQHVSPRIRGAMSRRHLAWARLVRIADATLVDLVHEEAQNRARVLISLAWYRSDDPYLRMTTLEQTWRDGEGGWRIVREQVVDGDESLLAVGSRRGPPRDESR